jgi:uridine kinase
MSIAHTRAQDTERPTLFLVDGAGGTGKSDLLKHLTEIFETPFAQFLPKYSTRAQRGATMPRDIIPVSDEEFDTVLGEKRR